MRFLLAISGLFLFGIILMLILAGSMYVLPSFDKETALATFRWCLYLVGITLVVWFFDPNKKK